VISRSKIGHGQSVPAARRNETGPAARLTARPGEA
jgi:hypothetical protein